MITTFIVSIILTITELVRVKQQLNDYNIVSIILTIILTITELVRVKPAEWLQHCLFWSF